MKTLWLVIIFIIALSEIKGCVFIVEKLDKPNRRAIYWITFFDIETKRVLLTEPIIGRPAGGMYT